MTFYQTNMHVEVSVKLNERFDFFPATLRNRLEAASSNALENTSTGSQPSSRMVWIVQDMYRITPDVTNPGMLEYTYNEDHVKFSQKVVGVYEALENANVAALSTFLDSSALVEDGEMEQDGEEVTMGTDSNDLDDYEDDDEDLGEDETDEQIPLRVKNQLRFVKIEDTNKIKLGYGDVGWGFDTDGALCLSTRQEAQSVADEEGHCAALDEKITVVVKRKELLLW